MKMKIFVKINLPLCIFVCLSFIAVVHGFNLVTTGFEPRCHPAYSGHASYPGNCTKFIQCHMGRTFVKNCDRGTAWNPRIGLCDHIHNVPQCVDAGTRVGRKVNIEDWESYRDQRTGRLIVIIDARSARMMAVSIH